MTGTPAWPYPQRVLFVAAVLALCIVAWLIADVLMLAFGGIVAAVVVRGLARRYQAWTGVSTQTAATLAAVSIVVLLAGVFWLVGEALNQQLGRLRQSLPEAWAAARGWLQSHGPGQQLLDMLPAAADLQLSSAKLASAAGTTFGALGSAALMLIVGVYFAADPGLYRDGLVRLAPPRLRERCAARWTPAAATCRAGCWARPPAWPSWA